LSKPTKESLEKQPNEISIFSNEELVKTNKREPGKTTK